MAKRKVFLSYPEITRDDRWIIDKVLYSKHLACGPYIEAFEKIVQNWICKKYVIAFNSGTSALATILKAIDVKDKEVIIPAFTFIATGNAVLLAGAVPVIVDITEDNLSIDVELIEKAITCHTKVIIPVCVFGMPCGVQKIKQMLTRINRTDIKIVEDSCEAVGTGDTGAGDAMVFSFYPNKQVIGLEGGVVCTDDDALAEFCQRYRNHGRLKTEDSDRVGDNLRMTEVGAALGYSQFSRLKKIVEIRRNLALAYYGKIKFKFPAYFSSPEVIDSVSYFSYPMYVKEIKAVDIIKEAKNEYGVECGHYFKPLNQLKHFKELAEVYGLKNSCPVADRIYDCIINLPFHHKIGAKGAEYVIESLRKSFTRLMRTKNELAEDAQRAARF